MAVCLTNITRNQEFRCALYNQAITDTGAPLWIGYADGPQADLDDAFGLWAPDPAASYHAFWLRVEELLTHYAHTRDATYSIVIPVRPC